METLTALIIVELVAYIIQRTQVIPAKKFGADPVKISMMILSGKLKYLIGPVHVIQHIKKNIVHFR